MLKSILIFPNFDNIKKIQSIREKYDSLYTNIRPHITLIFPFESELNEKDILKNIKKTLVNTKEFSASFQQVSGDFKNGYVWLEADEGREDFIQIHDVLYQNELFKPYQRKDIPYIPHITIGQSLSQSEATWLAKDIGKNIGEFKTIINKVSVERILDNNNSEEIAQIDLKTDSLSNNMDGLN